MKKTLFLSAILASALCSSAFAVDYTETVTSENSPLNLDAYLNNTNTAIYLTMDNGTMVTNANNNSDFNKIQITELTLNGTGSTASLNVADGKHYGFVRANFWEAHMSLNGGTLEKTGTGEMIIINTKVQDAGTLDLQAGLTKIYNQGSNGLVGDNLALKVGSSATLEVDKNSSVLSLSNAGTLKVNSGKTLSVVMNNGSAVSLTGGTISGGGKVFINNNNQKAINCALDLTTVSSGTTLSLKGIRGTLKGEATGVNTIAGNIELTNTTNWAAVEWGGDFGTIEGSAYTFEGSISGDGNMALKKNNSTLSLTFSGDLSAWTAKGAAWMGLRANGSTILNVLINGAPTNTAIGNAYNVNTVDGATLNLTVDRDADFKGNINVSSLVINGGKTVTSEHATFSTTGKLELGNSAELTVKNANAAAIGTYVAMGDNSTLVLSNNTHMTVSDSDTSRGIWINAGASLSLQGTSSLRIAGAAGAAGAAGDTITITGDGAEVTRHDNSATAKLGLLDNNGQKFTKNVKVTNGNVVYSGSGTLYLGSMQGGSLTSTGNIEFAGADSTIGSLTLSGNTITLGTAAAHDNDLTITSTLAVTANSTMNANLIVSNGATMDFSNHTELTMGCTVTIGNNVTIKIDDSELASIVNTGSVMTIINNVEGVDMEHLELTLGSGWKFVDAQGNSLDAYNLRLDVVDAGDGKVNIVVAPEPATATLSLLALAALASRRRRH